MAKQTKEKEAAGEAPVVEVTSEVPATTLWDGMTPIEYDDLVKAKVLVKDANGNQYYLEPTNRSGVFVLRVLPK
jgi:hypothetical protein